MGNDATRFCKRIPIRANIQDIYNAWTIPAELEKWFLRKASFTAPDGRLKDPTEPAAKGDQYHWLWHGYGDDMYEDRPVLDANGRDLFSFKFSGDCTVKVHIKTEEGETICELWQENIPPVDNPADSLHALCGEGWTFYLANLKSILEGGLDLRNKNERLRRVISS